MDKSFFDYDKEEKSEKKINSTEINNIKSIEIESKNENQINSIKIKNESQINNSKLNEISINEKKSCEKNEEPKDNQSNKQKDKEKIWCNRMKKKDNSCCTII